MVDRRCVVLKVLYLGFVLPESSFLKLVTSDGGMPVQTQRFGWAVIEALRCAGVEVGVVSAAPAVDFPHNRNIVFRGHHFSERGVEGFVIPFVNVVGLKHLTRYVAVRRAVRKQLLLLQPDAVVIHGVHSPLIWRGIQLGKRLGIPVTAILTDPPSLPTRFDLKISTAMKKLDLQLIMAGLRRVDGVIALTDELAVDYAPHAPRLVMEGIANPLATSGRMAGSNRVHGRPRVVYAGGLYKEYGVLELIRSVEASEGTWDLQIYGRGPLEGAILNASAANDRIYFGGFAGTAALAQAYDNATVLVNPRLVSSVFTKYSFPSKLLEYLCTGRPVLSTRHAGIPEEYGQVLFWTDPDAVSMAKALDRLMLKAPDELDLRGAKGRAWALTEKGAAKQGRRMRLFFESLQVVR